MFSLSFVIPALNEEARIAKCIRSIRSEAPGSPIIVVDNGSTDKTAEIAMALPGVTVVHEAERGITHARQAGLNATNTRWVAFIDADNSLPDGWLLIAMRALMGKGVVAVSGPPLFHDMLVFSRGMIFAFYCVGKVAHAMGGSMLQGGGFVVDRQALIAAGGFDLNVDFYGEDTVTARRLSKVGKVKFDLGLYFISSARRLHAEGLFRIGTRYALNYAWVWLVGHPLTRTHRDHREDEDSKAA